MKAPLTSWFLAAVAIALPSCQRDVAAGDNASAAGDTGTAKPQGVVDADVAPHRRQLLELAFGAASKFPVDPHGKNRSRAQERVLVACFELDLPRLALGFAPRIQGWRRGLAYADYAWYGARHGVTEGLNDYLKMAQRVLDEQAGDPNAQQWRADKVRLKIARAYHALGELDKAQEIAGRIDISSSGAVDGSWTETASSRLEGMTAEVAQQELQRITDTFLEQSLGAQYTSLMLLAGMHGRCFEDAEFRAACEERVVDRFHKLPPNLRLDAIAAMVGNCLDHEDKEHAAELLGRMVDLIDRANWRTEDLMPERARVAELRVRLGEPERARQELEKAVADYLEARDGIVDIYRCETLRPLALGFATLGDHERTVDLLATAIEEGMTNPNSRPRCDDLVESCVAMAKRDIEPSEVLWTRMREIAEGLGDPW